MKFSRILQSVFMFVALFLFSATFFALLGYGALQIMPCHWFGSAFEGGCGYRAILFTSVVCVVLTLIFTTIGMAMFLGTFTPRMSKD